MYVTMYVTLSLICTSLYFTQNTKEENLELIHALDSENTGYITWITWVTTLLDVSAHQTYAVAIF